MKIDRSKLKKYLPETSVDCKLFIDKLKSCDRKELHQLLKSITIWRIGKCVLYDWIDALDLFDSILEEACIKTGKWMLNCDKPENEELKFLILDILHFTTLLIEHTYSRHIYNSIEYLIILLQSSNLHIVSGVLSLLYLFSKRSNFITRLPIDEKQALISRVIFLAENWGGRENGLDLARCCSVRNPSDFPEYTTNLHFPSKSIDILNVHMIGSNAAAVMEMILAEHNLSEDKQIKLFTQLRLVYTFPSFDQRLLYIQARLQALSILIYSVTIEETKNVFYHDLIEELVEVLNIPDPILTDVKKSVLKTLTSIIHLQRRTKYSSCLQEIIEATQANSYHGFLSTFVRQCIDTLTSKNLDDNNERFPQSLSTELLSFLYHLASYEKGGDALINCDIMQSLIKVINYYDESQDFVMFVTRAVRVIDLITTLDMTSFEKNNGLQVLINRLEHEITQCQKEQPFIICIPKCNQGNLDIHPSSAHFHPQDENHELSPISGLSSYHQRVALLKSILNYLKKVFTEPTMADTIRHIMDSSLPNSLKHIISNVEYYGPSLFHLATSIVTSFIFQEPSQLSFLQDNGLIDVLMHALLIKDVPVIQDLLASLPNIFAALCLNTRGLKNFMEYKPFDKLFRVFLSSEYLPAMKRRRGETDTIYCTASSFGNALDELMRYQVSLRTQAIKSIIILLEQLVELGNNPKYSCQKPHLSSSSKTTTGNDRNSSDDEYDDDEEPLANQSSSTIEPIILNQTLLNEKQSDNETIPIAIPLLDYIKNIMRFIEGVINNNNTIDDHAREFVKLGGLKPLINILQMKNLPINFSSSQAYQSVVILCKSIFKLLIKDNKLIEIIITNLDIILNSLTDFYLNRTYDDSLLIEESSLTPILHQLSIIHSHILLLISLCKISISLISFWGTETGIHVLKNLNKLYLTLIWENSILLSLSIHTIKPLLCISSKLQRDLGELYNLLVKQCSTSKIRDFNQQPTIYTPTVADKLVASILIEIIRDGFLFPLPENQIEKFCLTFFVVTIDFTISMLFDEHHHPYILMLQQFQLSKGQDAFFSALELTLNLINHSSLTSQLNNTLPIEFINLSFILILRLVNVESILKSPYSIHEIEHNDYIPFDPLDYLILIHKRTYNILINSCSILWNKPYLLKDYATKIINNILSIFCHILQNEEQLNLTTSLSKESVAHFIDSIMLKILDRLPDTVYKMSELVITTIRYHGIFWRDHFLEIIANDIKTSYLSLIELLDKNQYDEQSRILFLTNHQNSILFTRILLISLLFEEIPFSCVRIADKFSLINHFCILINRTTNYLIKLNENKTPIWLPSIFLFIDLYEKVSLTSKYRSIINENYRDYNRIWQWFDEHTIRWNNYPSIQNKQINSAYANGESSCKIILQNKNYFIQFSTMLQINEDTHDKQPIMLTFSKLSNTNDNQYQRYYLTTESLDDNHALILINDCIHLIRILIDPNVINALLRLILRLTRNYKYAKQFVQSNGVQSILNLTQTSAFQGCTSLIILIFRHIMEDNNNLRTSMEIAIRQALKDNHENSVDVQSDCSNSMLRILGPVITRAPDIFLKVASDVLPLSISPGILKTQSTTYDQIGELGESLLNDLINFFLTNNNPKYFLSKSTILYILSEFIYSYSNLTKFISTKSVLSYILDYLLLDIDNQHIKYDKNIPRLSYLFLISIIKSNHCLESQINLINQIKISLNKIFILSESNEKYIRLQILINIINIIIKSSSISKQQQHQIINYTTSLDSRLNLININHIEPISDLLQPDEDLFQRNIHEISRTSTDNDDLISPIDLISNLQDIQISTTNFPIPSSTSIPALHPLLDPKASRLLYDQAKNINDDKIYTIHTTLTRWIEESIVLDRPYLHDTILTLKSKINHLLEKQYSRVILVKQDEERKKHPEVNGHELHTGLNIDDINGSQLLDYESICRLLVLLFIDDTRLNLTCLQNIIKNLCYHKQTREWIIEVLLSIINKSTEYNELKLKNSSINNNENENHLNPSYLTIHFENAFDSHTNIFKIQLHDSIQISIHTQAYPIVCRQVFELLIILFKNFPEKFLPLSLEIDFQSSSLVTLLLMLDHPILNKNNQLMDKLFELLLLISQSIQTTTNNKLVGSDNQIVFDSQLDLIIKTLISKSCTTYGLEFAIIFLLNLSKMNPATRDKVLHLLFNGIRLLGKDVNEEIKKLHWEDSNTNQQFFLRILKFIIQLHEAIKKEQIDGQVHLKLNDLLNINHVWDSLSDCLLSLAKLRNPRAVLVLQPMIEAFFLVHVADLISYDTQKLIEFAHKHRIVLNELLRQSKQHLNEGPFYILINYKSILDFDIKRKYFRHELDGLKENLHDKSLTIHVRRNYVFEDSYKELSQHSPEDWKHKFYILFDGEEVHGASGLLSEWYSIKARSIFDRNYVLFMKNTDDHGTFMPNPLSYYNKNHLEYFKFIGYIIGKAIFDNKYMDCYFTRPFYKYILDIPIHYTDMKLIDLEFYQNLVILLENDIDLDLTFSLDVNEKMIELIPNGSAIRVTNENKCEYIRLVCQEKIIGSIKQQMNSFLEGFYEIIPKSLISIFNEQELELLISGLPDINIKDLQANK